MLKTEAEILREARVFFQNGDISGAFQQILLAMTDYQKPNPDYWGFTAGMPRLDAFCQKLGRRLREKKRKRKWRYGRSVDVYLASEIYYIGGHTALIGDYVGNNPQRSSHLLVSNHQNNPAPAPNNARVRTRLIRKKVEVCPETDLAAKTLWLMSRIEELQPDRLFLFNHPEDPTIVAAAQPDLARSIYFVHHADHTPALGLYLRCTRHLDLTPRALCCCHDLLDVSRAIYLPLQSPELPGDFVVRKEWKSDVITIASSGSFGKFSYDGEDSYPAVITRMLAATNSRHIHIGPLPPAIVEQWIVRLTSAGIDPDRLVFVPWVTSLERAMHDLGVDIYLNSFPNGGARAAIEIMGSSTPILLHVEPNNRARHSANLIYPEAAWWEMVDELLRRIREATPEWLAEQRAFSRRQYDRFHARTRIAQLFEKDPIGGIDPLPIHEEVLEFYRARIGKYRKDINLRNWLAQFRCFWRKKSS